MIRQIFEHLPGVLLFVLTCQVYHVFPLLIWFIWKVGIYTQVIMLGCLHFYLTYN